MQARLEPHTRQRRHLECLFLAQAVTLLAALTGSLVFAQKAKELTPEQGKEVFQEALGARHRTKPELVASLLLYAPSHLLTSYWVDITNDHSPDRPPREIRITERKDGRSTLLYDRREQDMFLYMFPLDVDQRLLVTVWSSATTPTIRIFHISDGRVKLVMENASVNDAPQFIQGSVGMGGIVLLGRGRQMRDNLILPTREQIWQWDSAADKFILRATVPYELRWSKVSDILQHSG